MSALPEKEGTYRCFCNGKSTDVIARVNKFESGDGLGVVICGRKLGQTFCDLHDVSRTLRKAGYNAVTWQPWWSDYLRAGYFWAHDTKSGSLRLATVTTKQDFDGWLVYIDGDTISISKDSKLFKDYLWLPIEQPDLPDTVG